MNILKYIRSLSNFYSKSFFTLLLVFFVAHVQAQYLRANGTKIVDSSNNTVYLKGMNIGNWLLWEGYLMMGDFNYRTHTQFLNSLATAVGGIANAKEFEHQWRLNYVTEQTIIDLKNLGFNSVRVPFHYNMFWQNGGVSNHGFQYIDRLVTWCRTHGVYILLDMHAAPGYQNPGDHSDNVNSNSSQPRDTVKFWDGDNVKIASQVWRHIANYYKNEPMIWGYDLINEPVLQAGREYELLGSMITMRNAIREVDNNHIIVAEGGWWASQMQFLDWKNPTTQSATGVSARWDNNLVYETHHYVFGNAGAINDLNARKDITNNLGVPLILGEYGEDTPQILRTMTDWSIANIAGYFPWSFKKMTHDKTLWTIPQNTIYSQVVNFIKNGGTPPANAYTGMINFAKNNIANGSAGIQYHQDFYDAVKYVGITLPPSCATASYKSIGKIEAESYCEMTGIQTENTSDTGGGLNVGYLDVGDWMDYRINVPSAGTYTVTYRVASPNTSGEILFQVGGATLASTVIPSTGGWQNWTNKTASVSLAAGNQKMRLYVRGAGFNINYFQIASTTTSSAAKSSVASSSTLSSAVSGTLANGTYKVINAGSGGRLGVRDAATHDGADVLQGGTITWQVTSLGSGQYKIIATHSNKALDVRDHSLSNGGLIQQWSYTGGNNQRWKIENRGSGSYSIISVESNKALDLKDGSTANGASIQQWDFFSGNNNQLWKFTP
jgi:endoglucanase